MEHNIDKRICKLNLLMCPRQEALQHPAAVKLLDYAISGCPADCGESWDRDHIEKAMIRGAHRSALAPLASEELLKETVEKVRNGFAKIIRYGDIKDRLPENLKISPVAMIPHKSRKFRCILDLSFCLKIDGTKMPSVNSSTTQTAPQNSMDELGRVLERLGSLMASAPESSPNFLFSKLDIADDFWRVRISEKDSWNFCYVLPDVTNQKTFNLDEVKIVVPHSLQMGWTESPPFFCMASETARDVAETLITTNAHVPVHPLERYCVPPKNWKDQETDFQSNFISQLEVYMDDFIAMSQFTSSTQLNHISRRLLHVVHCVFPPPSISKHKGLDPISIKNWNKEKDVGNSGRLSLVGCLMVSNGQ